MVEENMTLKVGDVVQHKEHHFIGIFEGVIDNVFSIRYLNNDFKMHYMYTSSSLEFIEKFWGVYA